MAVWPRPCFERPLLRRLEGMIGRWAPHRRSHANPRAGMAVRAKLLRSKWLKP